MAGSVGTVTKSIGEVMMGIFFIGILIGAILISTVQFNTTLNGITGANTNIGTTGQTPIQMFGSVISNYSTLVSFVGLIILLLLVGMLFIAFKLLNWAKTVGAATGSSEA